MVEPVAEYPKAAKKSICEELSLHETNVTKKIPYTSVKMYFFFHFSTVSFVL